MFLLEMEESRTELAALEEKLAISERDLKENSQKYESIRIEYDRLEEKIGGLDGQIDSERARNNENQLKRQQLAGQMEVLREQIRSVETSRKNQLERLETIEKDLTEQKKRAGGQPPGIKWPEGGAKTGPGGRGRHLRGK